MLPMCLSGLFVHGFLPDRMLAVVLVPIIKDKTGIIDRIDNYRPIALTSVVSKGAATRYDSPARSLPIALYMGQS